MNALSPVETVQMLGVQARAASTRMAAAAAAVKNLTLKAIARRLREQTSALQSVNALDLERARAACRAMVDRLKLTPA